VILFKESIFGIFSEEKYQKCNVILKIELPGKFSYFSIPHKKYISDNRNTPQKTPLKSKNAKKALKDDVKAKSAHIHYFYPNI